jgi:hypothetical protein
MIAYGLQGLAALGLDMPADPDTEMVQQALKEVDQLLAGRRIADLLNSPPATDERAIVRNSHRIRWLSLRLGDNRVCCLCRRHHQVIQKLISKMAVGYYFVKPNAYTYALATGVRLSLSLFECKRDTH